MARKRSRSQTEQRFEQAVLELIAESGCAQLGINPIATKARYDKVLIYRYFRDLDGLLQRAAESRRWLPEAEKLCADLPADPIRILKELAQRTLREIRSDAPAYQLSRWRLAVRNPLTEQYTNEWTALWKEIPGHLGLGLSYAARENWTKACALLALVIQAELANEALDPNTFDTLAAQLESPIVTPRYAAQANENPDMLPTNLL